MIYDLTISMMTTWSPDWGQSDFQVLGGYHAAFRHGITFNFRPQAPPKYLNTDFHLIKTLILTPTIIIAQPTSHRIR